ncbi:MAG: T9SS type A sorting domain-containing protein [Syntrophomonadaceae bacterium]
MSTESFTFEKDASVSTDLWVKKSGWKNDVKLTLELVEEGSEKLLQKVYEGSLSLKEPMVEEKTFKITNRFTGTKAYLRVSMDGIAKENLIVNDMDYYLLSSGHDKVQKPEQEIVESEIAPVEYALSQNFPNPFNPSTVINYQIPKASKVTLKVYDMLGKEVATLIDGYKEMGSYSVQFNASSLPSGIYIYEIRTNEFIKSGKMMLLK